MTAIASYFPSDSSEHGIDASMIGIAKMSEPGFRLADVNHVLFSLGNDYVDFIETDMLCGDEVAAGLPERGGSEGSGSRFVLCPPTYYSLSNGIADNRRINDMLLGIAARSGDRAMGVAEPRFRDAAHEEIDRIAALGAAGMVWCPRAQGVFADDQHIAGLCHHVHAAGMVSLVRAAPYSMNESIRRLWHLAEQCGDFPLVIVGAFASWESIQTIQHLKGPENISYDVSGIAAARDLQRTVDLLGPDRLLFGSGGPRFLKRTLETVAACTFDEAAKSAILWDNAAALFKP